MIEAGLGGRYDATNVIPSRVQVLTSVGLEHTRWLGPDDRRHRAREARRRAAGRDARARRRPASRRARGWRRARRRRARRARSCTPAPTRASQVGALGRLPAAQLRARARPPPRRTSASSTRDAVAAAAAEVRVPGRLQIVGERAADAARRRPQPRRDRGAGRVAAGDRRRARPRRRGRLDPRRQGRRRDAGGAAARACDALVFTSSQNPRALAAADARSRSPASSTDRPSEVVRDPRAALARARELAGPDGRRARDRLDLPRSPTCCARRAADAPRCCERRRRSARAS